MSKPEDPHELKSFEAKLAALVPRDDRLDRERLAFLAGQASVTANTGWQRHPGWPAAFAAMSVLAATLLMMLITRPAATSSATGAVEIATSDHPHAPTRIEASGFSDKSPETLSARDALGGDIEQRLTNLSKVKSPPQLFIERSDSPSLTPAAWRRVSDSARSPVPSAGSSSPPVFWRANS